MPVGPSGYPLDLTGEAVTNLIIGETHEFNTTADRVFVPDGGPFYVVGLEVRHSLTNELLAPITDYTVLHLVKDASMASRKEVCAVIWVHNTAIPGAILQYQIIGSHYAETAEVIRQLLADNPPIAPVVWGQIIGAPVQYTPAAHLTDAKTIFGLGPLVSAIERLRGAVSAGDEPAFAAVYQYLNMRLLSTVSVDDLNAEIAARTNNDNIILNALSSLIPTPLSSGLVLTSTGIAAGNWSWQTPSGGGGGYPIALTDGDLRPVAVVTAIGGTKTADLLDNVIIDSYAHDTVANNFTYVLSFDLLPAPLTDAAGVRNFVFVTEGGLSFTGEVTLVDANTLSINCVYETNVLDPYNNTLNGVLWMKDATSGSSSSPPRFDVKLEPGGTNSLSLKPINGGFIFVGGRNRGWPGATIDISAQPMLQLMSVFIHWDGTSLSTVINQLSGNIVPRRNSRGIVVAFNLTTLAYDDTTVFVGHFYRNTVGLATAYPNMGQLYVRSYHNDCGTMVAGFVNSYNNYREARPYSREGRVCQTARLMGYNSAGPALVITGTYDDWGQGAQALEVPYTDSAGDEGTTNDAIDGEPQTVLGVIAWPFEEIRVAGHFCGQATESYPNLGVRVWGVNPHQSVAYATVLAKTHYGVAGTSGSVTGYFNTTLETIHYSEVVYNSMGDLTSQPKMQLASFLIYDMIWSPGAIMYGASGTAGVDTSPGDTRLIVQTSNGTRNDCQLTTYPGNSVWTPHPPYY